MARVVALPTITDDSALGGAVIERSFRFDRAASTHLAYTPSSASTDRTKITISAWVKKCDFNEGEYSIFHAGTTSNDRAQLRFYTSSGFDNISFFARTSGTFILQLDTTAKFRDTTGWYHIVARCDTTNGTANIYVNGEEVTNFTTSTKPSGSQAMEFFNNSEHQIGERGYDGSGTYFNGYMAEINVIQGQALDASYFGYTEFQTGIWRPKRYTGTYGDGFHLDFSDNSSITNMCLDKSGNGNHFSPDNCNVEDSTLDTPSNTFATLNPLSTSKNTLSNGNLYSTGGGASWRPVSSDMAMSSGKWYWEIYIDTVSSYQMHGIRPQIRNDGDTNHDNDYYPGTREDEWAYETRGYLHNDASPDTSWGDTYAAGDIIGVALDMDAGTLNFYKNGSATGSQITGVSAVKSPDGSRGDYLACCCVYGSTGQAIVNFGQEGTFDGHKTAQNNTDINGIGNFYYTPPTGFKALCTANLRGDSSYVINSQKHFGVVTYTGNGSTQSITGLEFSPDLVWVKERSSSSSHGWGDTVRGALKVLQCDITDAEVTTSTNFTSFDSNGFTHGNGGRVNQSSQTYVAWCWKGGGSSNTYNIDGTGYGTASAAGLDGGTITPTGASINTKAGFSIITYTGNGTSGATVAHGLGKKPVWVVIKCRSNTDNWMVYHQGLNNFSNPHHYYVELNANGADINSVIMFNDTAPTTSLMSFQNDHSNNGPSKTYVAYSWAEIPGYSKFGTYKGNGSSSNGSYIHLGFRPALIIMKKFSGSDSWEMHDSTRTSYNNMKAALFPSSSNTESTSSGLIDFLSNGFKHYNANGNTNEDGHTYMYMAFAERVGETPYATFPNAR